MVRWDLGIAGLGLLAVMSLAFGLVAHLIVGGRVTRWLWLYSAVAYFLAGILVSEVCLVGRRKKNCSRTLTDCPLTKCNW